MPTPTKPLTEKKFVRPGRHGDRMEAPAGVDPADYPAPSWYTPEHVKLWGQQLSIFAGQLRPADMLTFRMYIDAQIEYQDLAETIYLDKRKIKESVDPEEIDALTYRIMGNQKEHKVIADRLMKLQDKMCANPYNRARVPDPKKKEKSLEETLAAMMD